MESIQNVAQQWIDGNMLGHKYKILLGMPLMISNWARESWPSRAECKGWSIFQAEVGILYSPIFQNHFTWKDWLSL